MLDDRKVASYDTQFIDGAWLPAVAPGALEVVDPSTEEVIGRVPAGTAEEADAAVRAAQRAFPGWAALPQEERVAALHRIGATMEAHAEELAVLVSREVGSPLPLARRLQVGVPILTFASMAELVTQLPVEERVDGALVRREPIGVVAAITPWNFPLHQIALKVAPALAVGCTVVLKPSEVAPLAAYRLMELISEAGLPPGVLNMVCGMGPVVGEALARHPAVSMVTFTGSTAAGRRVSEVASATVKRVTLELGGKGALVILPDVEGALLEEAVTNSVTRCFNNSGQSCAALTRLLVPRLRLPEVELLASRLASDQRLGPPSAAGTTLGPVVSDTQRERVRRYIRQGIAEGAKLVVGGEEAPEDLPVGFYVRPTVFSEVRPEMTVAAEEIFGPVLVILPYDNEAEAVELANATPFGLTSSVWSADTDRAVDVAGGIRAGMVDVNGGNGHHLGLPFGGMKQSGNGREFGTYGLAEFVEMKALNVRPPRPSP